ncbi:hypothetical protein SLA2020_442370 [Shorea laevis]
MAAEKATNESDIEGEDDLDEEPGEVIESAPPLKVGEERELGSFGLKKKLLKSGHGWETPELGDEVTVHYGEPLNITLGHGQVVTGLDQGIITMKMGETSMFTLPPELGYGAAGLNGVVPPNSVVQFEVQLVSWITVVDVCKDGGIIKKIMEKGERNQVPGDLDEVLVKYRVVLDDGTVVAETPEEGFEFYVKDGHLCPALPKAVRTMKRGEKSQLVVQPQYAFGEEGRDMSNGVHSIPPSSLLNIDVELVSFKPVIDITGDSKVLKKILKEGEGDVVANEGAAVTISYVAKLEDGTVFEKKGIDGEQPLEFITDEEQVIAGLDRAVATMKKGEQAILTIHPEFGFGSSEVRRDLSVIPPSSNVVYEVEMLNFLREKYEKAADYISEDESFGDDEESLLNNKSFLLVLDIEFHNVKALYRRAQAYMETADFFSAELDIKKALETDPQNREVKLIQKNLKQLKAESNKRESKLYINMFARMTRDTPVATKKLKVEKAEDEENVAVEMESVADSSAPPDSEMAVDSG